MQSEVRVTAQHLTLPPATRTLIEHEVAVLERHYPRLVECEVKVQGPSQRHQNGGEYSVALTVGLPGPDIHVSRRSHGELDTAVREAFRTAKRQLDERQNKKRRRH